MRREWTLALLMIVAMVLGGCQTVAKRATEDYYQRIEFKKPTASLTAVGVEQSSAPVTEEDIQRALRQTADLRVPMKLAFFEVAGATDYRTAQRFKQLPSGKREAWQRKLIDSNLFSGVQEVAGILLPPQFDLKSLRLAGARLGCDALLVYAANTDMYHYSNGLSVTYLLVLPIWLAPGTHVDSFTGLSAAVVDVKTGKVLTGFSTVGEGRQVIPYGFEDVGERRSVVAAHLQALDEMADKIVSFGKTIKKERE